MGYAGNEVPQYIIPSVIATKNEQKVASMNKKGIEDLDFYIGSSKRSL